MVLKNLSIKEIKYKLLSKGISRYDIDEYIEKHEEEMIEYEINSAYKILLKKSEQEMDQTKEYLLKKGYSRENVKKAILRFEK